MQYSWKSNPYIRSIVLVSSYEEFWWKHWDCSAFLFLRQCPLLSWVSYLELMFTLEFEYLSKLSSWLYLCLLMTMLMVTFLFLFMSWYSFRVWVDAYSWVWIVDCLIGFIEYSSCYLFVRQVSLAQSSFKDEWFQGGDNVTPRKILS